jgi:hypothetical protein
MDIQGIPGVLRRDFCTLLLFIIWRKPGPAGLEQGHSEKGCFGNVPAAGIMMEMSVFLMGRQ